MACNYYNKKKDLNYIKNIAIKYSNMLKTDIQIYKAVQLGNAIYDFEPFDNKRDNIIEIIKWEKE